MWLSHVQTRVTGLCHVHHDSCPNPRRKSQNCPLCFLTEASYFCPRSCYCSPEEGWNASVCFWLIPHQKMACRFCSFVGKSTAKLSPLFSQDKSGCWSVRIHHLLRIPQRQPLIYVCGLQSGLFAIKSQRSILFTLVLNILSLVDFPIPFKLQTFLMISLCFAYSCHHIIKYTKD